MGLHSLTVGDSQVTESVAKSSIFIPATLMTTVLRMYLLKTAAVFCGVFLWSDCYIHLAIQNILGDYVF